MSPTLPPSSSATVCALLHKFTACRHLHLSQGWCEYVISHATDWSIVAGVLPLIRLPISPQLEQHIYDTYLEHREFQGFPIAAFERFLVSHCTIWQHDYKDRFPLLMNDLKSPFVDALFQGPATAHPNIITHYFISQHRAAGTQLQDAWSRHVHKLPWRDIETALSLEGPRLDRTLQEPLAFFAAAPDEHHQFFAAYPASHYVELCARYDTFGFQCLVRRLQSQPRYFESIGYWDLHRFAEIVSTYHHLASVDVLPTITRILLKGPPGANTHQYDSIRAALRALARRHGPQTLAATLDASDDKSGVRAALLLRILRGLIAPADFLNQIAASGHDAQDLHRCIRQLYSMEYHLSWQWDSEGAALTQLITEFFSTSGRLPDKKQLLAMIESSLEIVYPNPGIVRLYGIVADTIPPSLADGFLKNARLGDLPLVLAKCQFFDNDHAQRGISSRVEILSQSDIEDLVLLASCSGLTQQQTVAAKRLITSIRKKRPDDLATAYEHLILRPAVEEARSQSFFVDRASKVSSSEVAFVIGSYCSHFPERSARFVCESFSELPWWRHETFAIHGVIAEPQLRQLQAQLTTALASEDIEDALYVFELAFHLSEIALLATSATAPSVIAEMLAQIGASPNDMLAVGSAIRWQECARIAGPVLLRARAGGGTKSAIALARYIESCSKSGEDGALECLCSILGACGIDDLYSALPDSCTQSTRDILASLFIHQFCAERRPNRIGLLTDVDDSPQNSHTYHLGAISGDIASYFRNRGTIGGPLARRIVANAHRSAGKGDWLLIATLCEWEPMLPQSPSFGLPQLPEQRFRSPGPNMRELTVHEGAALQWLRLRNADAYIDDRRALMLGVAGRGLPGTDWRDTLHDFAEFGSDSEMRMFMARNIAQLAGTGHSALLDEFLGDADPAIREQALASIAEVLFALSYIDEWPMRELLVRAFNAACGTQRGPALAARIADRLVKQERFVDFTATVESWLLETIGLEAPSN